MDPGRYAGRAVCLELHEDLKAGVNPFEYYGKKLVARFIVEIVEKNQ